MPDITMCSGANCELKDSCYRYTARPNMYNQSYFLGTPKTAPDKCDSFWDNEEKNTGSFDYLDFEDILD